MLKRDFRLVIDAFRFPKFSLDGVVSRFGTGSCTVVCSIGASGTVTAGLADVSAVVAVSNAGGSVG
jgi:hypothetical protein